MINGGTAVSLRQINWDQLSSIGVMESGVTESTGEAADITGGKRTSLTIGVFDGLHRGHQALIAKITAKAPELLPVVVTFRENPKRRGFEAKTAGTPKDIIAFEEKLALLDSLGVALCVIIDFSERFSKLSGAAFLEDLCRYLRPAYIALGTNFHCGHRRDTDAGAFKAMAEQLGIEAEIIPPVLEGGKPVSSSRIRAALEAGDTGAAGLLLGR